MTPPPIYNTSFGPVYTRTTLYNVTFDQLHHYIVSLESLNLNFSGGPTTLGDGFTIAGLLVVQDAILS